MYLSKDVPLSHTSTLISSLFKMEFHYVAKLTNFSQVAQADFELTILLLQPLEYPGWNYSCALSCLTSAVTQYFK